MRIADRHKPLLVFLVCFFVYIANGSFLPGNDTLANVYVPASFLEYGSAFVDPATTPQLFRWEVLVENTWIPTNVLEAPENIAPLIEQGRLRATEQYAVVRTADDLFANTFGLGVVFISIPFFFLVTLGIPDLLWQASALFMSAKVLASLLTAGTVTLMFLTLRRQVTSTFWLYALTGAFAFGTSLWSLSSQALWQSTFNLFFVTLTLFFVARESVTTKQIVFAGAAASAAVLMKPTSGFFVIGLLIYLWFSEREKVSSFILGGLPLAVVFFAYNLIAFDSLFAFGQTASAGTETALYKTGTESLWQTSMLTGLFGTLLSPSRGLFVFSPFLLLIFAGLAQKKRSLFMYVLSGVTLAIVLLQSKWFDWWGGHTYGNRALIDTLPYLMLLLVPAAKQTGKRRWFKVLFAAFAVFAVFLQGVGAFAYNHTGWNVKNNQDVDLQEHRHRLWSWSDNQALHYITNFSEEKERKAAFVEEYLLFLNPTK